ncbi:MAG TPA: hypothetical protein VF458_10600 [Ktedonobacteraceae bacterium]
MDPNELPEPFTEDQQVEITDLPEQLRSRPAQLASWVQARFAALIPRRRWLQMVALLALALLCLALLLSATPGAQLLPGAPFASTPTGSASGPNIDQLYLNNGPTWARLSIDGLRVLDLPVVDQAAPLQLAPGIHHLRWQAAPFPTQTCTLSVPASLTDNCPASETTRTPNHQLAWIVTFKASLDFMSAGARRTLTSAISQALAPMRSSEQVNIGERFVSISPNNSGPVQTATRELNATLNLTLDNDENNPCNGGEEFSSCLLNGQNCFALCTRVSLWPNTWNVVALVQSSWTYTTPSGQAVAANMPDALGGAVFIQHFLPLTLSWDGADWSVQPAEAFLNGADFIPIACASSLDDNTISPSNLFGSSPWQSFEWHYISASNPASGCLLDLIALSVNSPTPVASAHILYLHHFGITLTANHLAQAYNPEMIHPDAYETQLIQQIARQSHIPLT